MSAGRAGGGQGNDPFAAVRAGTPAQVKPAGFLVRRASGATLGTRHSESGVSGCGACPDAIADLSASSTDERL